MLMKLTQGVPHNFQKTAPEIQSLEINKKINFLQIRKLAKKMRDFRIRIIGDGYFFT